MPFFERPLANFEVVAAAGLFATFPFFPIAPSHPSLQTWFEPTWIAQADDQDRDDQSDEEDDKEDNDEDDNVGEEDGDEEEEEGAEEEQEEEEEETASDQCKHSRKQRTTLQRWILRHLRDFEWVLKLPMC